MNGMTPDPLRRAPLLRGPSVESSEMDGGRGPRRTTLPPHLKPGLQCLGVLQCRFTGHFRRLSVRVLGRDLRILSTYPFTIILKVKCCLRLHLS